MPDGEHILISLEPRYASSILDGSKRVELRRRRMRVSPGAIVWLYAKLPVGSLVGYARVEKTHAASPIALWRQFGSVAGVTRKEFFDYFEGVPQGVALVLVDAVRLRAEISLQRLRESTKKFQPPQFFSRLAAEHPVLHEARSAARQV